MLKVRDKNDQQEVMYPCEINKMAKKSYLRVAETLPGLAEGSTVFRVDFLSEDPVRVFGACAVMFEKGMTPFEFTDELRKMATTLDEFLHRGQDD